MGGGFPCEREFESNSQGESSTRLNFSAISHLQTHAISSFKFSDFLVKANLNLQENHSE